MRRRPTSAFHVPFARVSRGPCRWFFGWNTQQQRFIVWSDTSGTTRSAKWLDTYEELMSYLDWHLSKDWVLDRVWPENESQYAPTPR